MSGYLVICSLITELGQVNDSITLLAMLIVGLFVDKYKNNPQDGRTEVFCAILFFFFFSCSSKICSLLYRGRGSYLKHMQKLHEKPCIRCLRKVACLLYWTTSIPGQWNRTTQLSSVPVGPSTPTSAR